VFCQSCGATLTNGAAFCPACGSPVNAERVSSESRLRSALRQAFTPVRPSSAEVVLKERRSGLGVLLIAVLVTVLFAIWGTKSNNESTSVSDDSRHSDSPSPASSEATRDSSVPLHRIGEEFAVGYWTYRCNGARWQPFVLTTFESLERPDAEFLLVDLSIRNNDRSASTLPPAKLVDNLGREYSESNKGTFVSGSFDVLKELNPGVSSRGYLLFDAPPGRYSLELSGGFESGEHALIDLSQPAPKGAAAQAAQVPVVSQEAEAAGSGVGQESAAPSAPAPRASTPASDEEQKISNPVVPAFTTYRNARFGFSVAYPGGFAPKEGSTMTDGATLVSPDGTARLAVFGRNNHGLTLKDYIRLRSAVDGKVIDHEEGSDWFAIIWETDDERVYSKTVVGNGSENSFTFVFPKSLRLQYDPVLDTIVKSFKPGDTSREW
jgi:hypothetical protein